METQIALIVVFLAVTAVEVRPRPTYSRVKMMFGYTGQNMLLFAPLFLRYFPQYREYFPIYFFAALGALSGGLVWKIPQAHVALATFWGRRLLTLKPEGPKFFAPWLPWVYSYVLIDYRTRTLDITGEFQHPSRDRVKVPGSVRWHPNAKSAQAIIDYLNRGGEGMTAPEAGGVSSRGVAELLKENAQAIIRSIVIGVELEQVTRMDKAELIDPVVDALTLEPTVSTGDQLRDAVREMGGVEDNYGWGIEIENVVIGDVSTSGRATEARNQAEEELFQRTRDIRDTETMMEQARRYADASGGAFSVQDAIRYLEEHKTARAGQGFAVPGLAQGVRELAAAIAAWKSSSTTGGGGGSS